MLNLWVQNDVEIGTKFSSHIEFKSFLCTVKEKSLKKRGAN